MSADKDKDDSPESKNNWVTPTVIVAVIGLIGTLVSLYVAYRTSTRPLKLAATETAAARLFQLPLVGLTPTTGPSLPIVTATIPPTATLEPTAVPPPATPSRTPTRTLAPTELRFCINARSIYVRAGPGTEYAAIGSLSFVDCLIFDRQDPLAPWLHIP